MTRTYSIILARFAIKLHTERRSNISKSPQAPHMFYFSCLTFLISINFLVAVLFVLLLSLEKIPRSQETAQSASGRGPHRFSRSETEFNRYRDESAEISPRKT